MNNNEQKSNKGLAILIICGVIAMGLIVACVFFPVQTFGLFSK